MEDIRSFGCGSIAGMVGKFVEMPFDTVKVRLQTQPPPSAIVTSPGLVFAGSLDCFVQTMRQEGVAALYRGLASPMFGAALETAILFSVYGKAKNYFINRNAERNAEQSGDKHRKHSNSLPLGQVCAAGAFTGLFTGVVLTPIELIKCRLQVQREIGGVKILGSNSVYYTGALNCFSHVVRSDGIMGLFRGGFSTLLREIPGTAIWFGAYEVTCEAIVNFASKSSTATNHSNQTPVAGPIAQIVGGAVAGCLYWLLPYPIDTIKTKIQTQTKRHTQWEVLKLILREEGIRGLYKGVGFTLVRAIPSSAAMFFTYEQMTAASRRGWTEQPLTHRL